VLHFPFRRIYKALREEIIKRYSDQRVNERFIYTANAVSYAFLINLFKEVPPDIKSLSFIGWWMPPVISYFGLLKWNSDSEAIGRIAMYIVKLEESFDKIDGGWEKLVSEDSNPKFRRRSRHFLRRSTMLFMILLGVGFVAATWQTYSALYPIFLSKAIHYPTKG
jgi:hypothetical protein